MTHLYDRNWTRRDIERYVGRMDQLAGIKLVEAGDGMERCSRILQVWTGTGLSFHILADRGLDISTCRYRGISLAWDSSVGEVHPSYFDPQGMEWLRTFQGGLFVTCGFDHYGAPSSDGSEVLGLHGRATSLPARFVNHCTAWAGDEYLLEVTGEVRQTRVLGENLVLRRRICTHLGSNHIQVEDELSNGGFTPHPYMMLYHFNLGFPLVSPDSRLHLDAEQTLARDEHSEDSLAHWKDLQAPTADYQAQVFRHVPQADGEGKVQVAVENPRLGVGLRLTYNRNELPYLFQWKMMGEGTYVLGIEPATCGTMEGRADARAQGLLPYLSPGESRSFALGIEVVEIP
jgi:hypothetical protein